MEPRELEKEFLTAKDIAELLETSISTAYVVIRQLNAELNQKGFLTKAGRIATAYFENRYGIGDK
ncbi:DNA-binding protein [Lapidilactobacillus mulanensis]|uniref:DNA-binding protein n=1 Tax=Lapidilactobacillus mulanensis TaxID=2485999 RepID=A0ABW4DNA2_9LACO|nr:hypothetical protein [Lapidilactobacillus mulanensis]